MRKGRKRVILCSSSRVPIRPPPWTVIQPLAPGSLLVHLAPGCSVNSLAEKSCLPSTNPYTNKKFRPLREVATTVPDDRLLLETDSPYLTPHPSRGRQHRNEPALIVHTAGSLAQLRGVNLEELSAQTTANARRLFRLD